MLVHAISFVVFLGAGGAASGPSADDSPAIRWEAPSECPGEADFEGQVAGFLGSGQLAEALDGRAFEARITVAAAGKGWTAQLWLRDGDYDASHELGASECSTLAARAAALTATTLDPFARIEDPAFLASPTPELAFDVAQPPSPPELAPALPAPDPEPDPAPDPEPDPAPEPEPDPEPDDRINPRSALSAKDPARASPERPPWRGLASVAGGISMALFESPNPSVAGELGAQRGLFRGAVMGEMQLAGRFRAADDPSIGGDLRAWSLGLRTCVMPRWATLAFPVCGSLGAGQVRAEGTGVLRSRVERGAWLWLGPELGVSWSLSKRLALLARVGAGFNLRRPSFSVEAPDDAYLMPLATGRAQLAVEFIF